MTPPGNGVEAHLWGAGGSSEASTDESAAAAAVDVSLMSPAERAEYEERKLKLRKAMVGGGGNEGWHCCCNFALGLHLCVRCACSGVLTHVTPVVAAVPPACVCAVALP